LAASLIQQASSAILLAARDFAVELPTVPRPWWEIFVGKDKTTGLVTAANAILGLTNSSCNDVSTCTSSVWIYSLVSSRGFLKLLVVSGEGSFNDHGSFLWDHQKELLEQQQGTTTTSSSNSPI
jgi:hypothetical protein